MLFIELKQKFMFLIACIIDNCSQEEVLTKYRNSCIKSAQFLMSLKGAMTRKHQQNRKSFIKNKFLKKAD